MADLPYISESYAEGSKWTPSDANQAVRFSSIFQEDWEVGHDPTGPHDDLLVAYAGGYVQHLGSGVYQPAPGACSGIDAVLRAGSGATGEVQIKLTAGMRGTDFWGVLVWPTAIEAGGLVPCELPAEKAANTVDVRLGSADTDFVVMVLGLR